MNWSNGNIKSKEVDNAHENDIWDLLKINNY